MMSEKAKSVTKEFRGILRTEGISNRNVSVTCKQTKENGKIVEIIYIIVLIPNTALDAHIEPIVEKFRRKYATKSLRFMFMSRTHCSK